MPLTALARPHLEALAALTRHVVRLGIAEESEILILDEIPARRGPMPARVGSRIPLALTSLGKALMLDMSEDQWKRHYDAGMAHSACRGTVASGSGHWQGYLERMRLHAARACAFDLEENEVGMRCISAPVREACGRIVAAVGIVSADRVLGEERKHLLCREVVATAAAISADLGWTAHKANGARSPVTDKVRRRVQVR
jgi:DNA-binding IclR family transcriptional regulator